MIPKESRFFLELANLQEDTGISIMSGKLFITLSGDHIKIVVPKPALLDRTSYYYRRITSPLCEDIVRFLCEEIDKRGWAITPVCSKEVVFWTRLGELLKLYDASIARTNLHGVNCFLIEVAGAQVDRVDHSGSGRWYISAATSEVCRAWGNSYISKNADTPPRWSLR